MARLRRSRNPRLIQVADSFIMPEEITGLQACTDFDLGPPSRPPEPHESLRARAEAQSRQTAIVHSTVVVYYNGTTIRIKGMHPPEVRAIINAELALRAEAFEKQLQEDDEADLHLRVREPDLL